MRHRVFGRRFGRPSKQRRALFRALSTSFFTNNGSISTTLEKAKSIRPIVEKLITLAKTSLSTDGAKKIHLLRQISAFLYTPDSIKNLIELSQDYKTRPGGYTRIIRTGNRPGDCAEAAVIQLVGNE